MRWIPRITAAVALAGLMRVHLEFAPAYDAVGVVVTEGILLRGLAVLAAIAAVVILQFDHPVAYGAGLLVSGITLATVSTHGWTGSLAGPAAAVAVVATGFLTGSGVVRWRAHRRTRISLGAFVLGRLSAGERVAVESHLRECSRCRTEAAELTPVAGVLGRADRDVVAAFFAEPLPRGAAAARAVPVPRRATRSGSHETPNTQ